MLILRLKITEMDSKCAGTTIKWRGDENILVRCSLEGGQVFICEQSLKE